MKRAGYARPLSKKQLRRGVHRSRVGGRWEKMGRLQLDFLVEHGLTPDAYVLDVACGALRAGIPLVGYLDPGMYYGIDINESLLEAGYELELPPELREKLPRDHLRKTDRFDCDFGVEFEIAIAQSLFTHVTLNDIRLCMNRVAAAMRPGGRFYATFFEAPRELPLHGILEPETDRKSKPRHSDRNPFWYYTADLEWAASFSPWQFRYIGGWNHPGNQKMIELTRTP